MCDSTQNTVVQNEVFPETSVNDVALQTTNTNFDFNVTPEISNVDANSLCNVEADKTLTSEYDLNSNNDTTVDTTVQSCLEKSSNNEQNEDYNMGDIVWAKIGKYPFWPSVVCVDPNSRVYFKKTKVKFFLHVRFCNDKGRRSWVKVIRKYCGKFELLSKYPDCLSYIKNNKKLMDTWNVAVEEADCLLKFEREERMRTFCKTFCNSDDLNGLAPYAIDNSSESTATANKIRTYSRKRSLTVPEQDNDSKIKTENISINGSTSSRSIIDIPQLLKSDDADSTVSDISLSYVYMGDMNAKMKRGITKKKRSTKTYPPKSSITDKFDLSDSMENSLEYNDDNSMLSDNPDQFTATTTSTTRKISKQRKLEICALEFNQEHKISLHSIRPKKTLSLKSNKSDKETCSNNEDQTNSTLISQSSSDVKKIVSKRIQNSKELTGGRKSTAVKSESSPEPDTTESETSSKNENFSSFFLVTKKNKQLFIKTLKKACVVCKNIENTIKCVGPCQSYFHEECLNKSEQRYHKNEPKIEIQKTQSRRKRRSLKCYSKKKDSVSKNLKNINEENTDNLEDKLLNQPISDDSKNINGICSDNENAPGLSEIEKVDKDSIQEIVTICITEEEKNVDDSIIRSQNKSVTNEKSLKSDSKYMCSLCKANKTICFLCGLDINDPEQKIVCKISNCGKYYHDKCLADWPQCQWNQNSKNNIRSVVCPHHVCHLCISDNPKSSCRTYFAPEKLIRCIKCPTAYHRSEYCLPAGSQVLSNSDIVCSRHYEPKEKTYHFNATWCFICTLGGALICCDLCPSSFHIECLNQNPSEFIGGYTCEECQTGRYPLYGEIVWVKIGNYRWWPAQIVFPNQVPDTVNVIAHSIGQFAVRFFGSYDYYWVNRGRVFNFHEGDDENMLTKNSMKGLDQVFQDAIIEAAQAHNAYILDKDKNDAKLSNQSSTKPPKYVRIKFNKPYGNVKNMELDNTAMTPCECDATKPDPCGPGSDCINRMLMFECHPQICPAGDKCNNQRFEKTLYPAMVPFLTKGRGWGLKTLEDIQEGTFVIEYVGDVIDEEEFQRRCVEMHQRNEQNYYFLTIDNSRMIDAGPKGNLSRFMNHSCEPNCVTQKWTVNGVTRIGLFALHDIPAGTELVFDYRLQSCSEVVKKPCQCGAARCSKFIGVKVEEEKKKVISVNDPDKSKATTKSKRKLLKLKDNASDSDKSKSSKVTNSDQSTSTTENVIDSSNTEKFDDSKKLKNKVSMGKPAIILKNETSESTETQSVLTKKCKTSMRNSIKMTKDDDVNSFESEEIDKSKQKIILPIPSSRKQLIKDNTKNSDSIVVQKKQRFKNYKKKNVTKTNILPLSKNYNELSVPTLLSDKIGHIVGLKNMKTASNRTKDLIQTEKINEASVVKKNESTVTQERSRHSLTRLAKSRHSFLSKEATKPIKPIKPKRKLYKEQKEITKVTKSKTKIEEMQSVKTVLIKKKELNKHNLLSKTYYKNDSCLICGKGHAELSCKNKKCPRVFHLSCMNKSKIVKSGFICPSHFCSMCKKRKVVARCKFCVKSFCMGHVKGNIFKDPLGNGMLCITHHPDKKSISKVVCASSVTPNLNVTSTRDVINKNDKSIDVAFTNTVIKDDLSDNVEEQFNIHTDEINEEEYISTQVIKDECDREYIHIGGFNVCNMSDLVTDQEECYIAPVDTDGDLFKPSSANVVIDIESASALYQSTDNLQLVSIATDNKDSHDYANVHFIPDVNSTKNKWLTTEP